MVIKNVDAGILHQLVLSPDLCHHISINVRAESAPDVLYYVCLNLPLKGICFESFPFLRDEVSFMPLLLNLHCDLANTRLSEDPLESPIE